MSRHTATTARRSSRSSGTARVRRRRRRLITTVLVMLVVAVAVAANHGPLTDYLHASARAEQKAKVVEEMEQQLESYKEHVKRLGSDDSLEVIARSEFVYARPGEDLFIITGGTDERLPGSGPSSGRDDQEEPAWLNGGAYSEEESQRQKGPIERFVEMVFGVFQ